jgi:small subunit ribosomal protein S13
MARIAGVDIPSNKAGEISLTYIFGIGRSLAKEILGKAGVDPAKKVQDWSDEEQNTVRNIIADEYKTEGELRGEVQMNIKRLMDIGCYRGIRHRPVYQCADRALKTTHVPVRAVRRLSLTRRKLPSNK